MLMVVLAILGGLFSGVFSSGGSIGSLVLAGYGGTATDKKDPSVKHDVISLAYVNEEINFSATVKDSDSGVDSVKLRYRIDGGEWRGKTMKNKKSRVYKTLLTAPNKPGTVEYYIKAEDEAGNVKYSGKSSNPHVIKAVYRPRPVSKTPIQPQPVIEPTQESVVSPQNSETIPEEVTGANDEINQDSNNDQDQSVNQDDEEDVDIAEEDDSSNMFDNIIIGLLVLAGISLGSWFFFRKKSV